MTEDREPSPRRAEVFIDVVGAQGARRLCAVTGPPMGERRYEVPLTDLGAPASAELFDVLDEARWIGFDVAGTASEVASAWADAGGCPRPAALLDLAELAAALLGTGAEDVTEAALRERVGLQGATGLCDRASLAREAWSRLVGHFRWGDRVGQLPPDERALASMLLGRLERGRRRYGEWDLATDRRDFRREALEEILDALHYCGAELLRERQATAAGRRVYVSAPRTGDPELDGERVDAVMADVAATGERPVCGWRLLSDDVAHDPANLRMVERLGLEVLELCDEVRVIGADVTPEMALEIEHAHALGVPVVFADEAPLTGASA